MSFLQVFAQGPVELQDGKANLWSTLIPLQECKVSVDLVRAENFLGGLDAAFDTVGACIESRKYRRAILYANYCISVASCMDDTLKVVQVNKFKASALRRWGKLEAALSLYNSAVQIAERQGYKDEVKQLLNSQGMTYMLSGRYDMALASYLQSYIHRKVMRNDSEMGTCLNNVGVVHYKLRNNQKALDYYLKALKLKGGMGIDNITIIINVGLCYAELGSYKEGLKYIESGLALYESECDPNYYKEAMFAMGMIRYRMKMFTEAEMSLVESLSISRSTQDNRFIAENLIYLARVFLDNGDLQKTNNYLTEARRIGAKHGFNELLLDTYRVFISFYQRKGDVARLSDYYLKYNALREEMQGRDLLQRVSAFEVEMEHEENLKTLTYQSNVMALQTKLLVSQRRIYFGITVLFVLIGIIIFLVWRKNVQKAKVNALLERLVIHRINSLNSKAKISTARNKQLTEGLRNRIDSVNILIQILGSSRKKSVTNKIYGVQFESVVEQMVILNSYHGVHFLDGIESLQTYD